MGSNGGSLIAGLLFDKGIVVYRPALARALGSPLAALFLCQAAYWQGKVGIGVWWYKLRDAQRDPGGNIVSPTHASLQSWEYELGMTRSEQETARRILSGHGLLKVALRGIPARNHYMVDVKKLEEFIVTTQLAESIQLGGEIPPTGGQNAATTPAASTQLDGGISPAITEVTSKVTTDIKTTTTKPKNQTQCQPQMLESSFEDSSKTETKYPTAAQILVTKSVTRPNPLKITNFPLQDGLIYPAVDRLMIEAMKKVLGGCPLELQQDVLDETEGRRIKGGLDRPTGFLFNIVKDAQQGTFVQNWGLNVRIAREKLLMTAMVQAANEAAHIAQLGSDQIELNSEKVRSEVPAEYIRKSKAILAKRTTSVK